MTLFRVLVSNSKGLEKQKFVVVKHFDILSVWLDKSEHFQTNYVEKPTKHFLNEKVVVRKCKAA